MLEAEPSNPKASSLTGKDTSASKGFHSTFAALFSYQGVVVRVRVALFATKLTLLTQSRKAACIILFRAVQS